MKKTKLLFNWKSFYNHYDMDYNSKYFEDMYLKDVYDYLRYEYIRRIDRKYHFNLVRYGAAAPIFVTEYMEQLQRVRHYCISDLVNIVNTYAKHWYGRQYDKDELLKWLDDVITAIEHANLDTNKWRIEVCCYGNPTLWETERNADKKLTYHAIDEV